MLFEQEQSSIISADFFCGVHNNSIIFVVRKNCPVRNTNTIFWHELQKSNYKFIFAYLSSINPCGMLYKYLICIYFLNIKKVVW